MALVSYSDSEESDTEVKQTASTKRLERTDGNKIKIELPSAKADVDTESTARASKRQRTTGGFNSLLPPPKRTAASGMKPGINLRTSSEAAFSRVPAPQLPESFATSEPAPEVKLVGKATRFMPLSVMNAKKKKPVAAAVPLSKDVNAKTTPSAEKIEQAAPSKPKQSLFSFSGDEAAPTPASTSTYEPEFIQSVQSEDLSMPAVTSQMHPGEEDSNNALAGVANDLNLSASDRRKLFGRSGAETEAAVSHFDMNSEYITNQGIAAKGETIHRTVKAIAPGRHSLQQLVSSAVGQREALEDHWAEGRRNRGEAGSKYGF